MVFLVSYRPTRSLVLFQAKKRSVLKGEQDLFRNEVSTCNSSTALIISQVVE